MPLLVDGKLTIAKLRQAIALARKEGPLTLDEGLDWLELNVRQPPHPPSSSKPPGTRGARRRRYETSLAHDRRQQRQTASAAA